MLSGLLITLNILVCIALICVVLMQRSEGGAFGTGGGPTGLITARGAGDLLTRTTWVLFGLFLALSLGLTLLGAHDRATSSVIEKLKLQTANPNALGQTKAPLTPVVPGQTPAGAPLTPFLAPPVSPPVAAPVAGSAAQAHGQAAKPTAHASASKPAVKAAAAIAPAPSAAAPAAPILIAPPPQPTPAPPASAPPETSQPKPNPDAPVSTGTP